MAKREEPTTFVHPAVQQRAVDPVAAAYAASINQRRGLPKDNTPVAGGAMPPMPRLDNKDAPAPGHTMAEHAMIGRGQIPAPRIQPGDILPEVAQKDPQFRSGTGAMFAANQPELAKKYGVIRSGRHIPPQELSPPTGQLKLSQKSLEGLNTLKELQNAKAPNLFQSEEEAAAAPSTRGAMANIGTTAAEAVEPPMEKKEIEKALSDMDEFQYDQFQQAMRADPLNNEEQRKIIEARLTPLSVEDLIINMTIKQRVPIIPGKFEPTFQDVPGDVDLALKRLIMVESKSLEVGDRYFLDKFALMSMTASLYQINGKTLPDYRDSNGYFDDDLFRTKLNLVLRYPIHMLASIGINATWFDRRVRALFVAEKVGNG